MNGHTTRFCFCASNLTSAVVLAGIFASLRVVAIFLLWYQIRPDINKTEAHTLIFTIYASLLCVYLLVDIFLLIGTTRQIIPLLWTWITMAILWSGLIIVGIVIDGRANFVLNTSTIIKMTSLVLVLWSIFVVIGAIHDIQKSKNKKNSNKWQHHKDDFPPSYEETMKIVCNKE